MYQINKSFITYFDIQLSTSGPSYMPILLLQVKVFIINQNLCILTLLHRVLLKYFPERKRV